MTAADPFDYPDDPVDLDAGSPEYSEEAAFWRDVRDDAGHRPEPAPHAHQGTPYADFIAEERRVAFTVPCPTCKVDIGAPCIRVDHHGVPYDPPEPLRRYPAHAPRLKAARRRINR